MFGETKRHEFRAPYSHNMLQAGPPGNSRESTILKSPAGIPANFEYFPKLPLFWTRYFSSALLKTRLFHLVLNNLSENKH